MLKKLIGISLICLLISSCALIATLFPETKKLYVSVDVSTESHSSNMTLITYLEPGASAGNGKNLINDTIETLAIDGRNWKVYEIPVGTWDIYMEWYVDVSDFNNYRHLFNLEDNDWGAIYINFDYAWLSVADEYQSTGEFSLPALPGL